MAVLDCGCGTATITLGLADAVPDGRVVGVDLAKDSILIGRRSAALMGYSLRVFQPGQPGET